jgi:hypothetical protein
MRTRAFDLGLPFFCRNDDDDDDGGGVTTRKNFKNR